MARKRRRSGRKGKRRSKAFYAKIGRKGARTRARRKAARRSAARKASRSRSRKGGRPKYRRGRKHRYVTRKYKGRYYASPGSPIKGRRVNPRRRRSYRRRNPGIMGSVGGLFPTRLGQFKDAAIIGAGGAAGYIGVGMLNGLIDKVGVGSLKAKISSPLLGSIVNAAESIVSAFLLAGVARMVIKNKPQFTNAVFAGGVTKAILDVALPLIAQTAAGGGAGAGVADAALSGFQEQLSGYQYQAGVSGFQTELGYTSPEMNRIAALNVDEATIYG